MNGSYWIFLRGCLLVTVMAVCCGGTDADISKPQLVLQIGHSEGVSALEFSPDGNFLVSSDNGDIKFWDAHTWDLIRTVECPGYMQNFALISGGRQLMSIWQVNKQNILMIHDVPSGKIVKTGKIDMEKIMAIDSANEIIAGTNAASDIFCLPIADRPAHKWKLPPEGIDEIVFSPDGKLLAAKSTEKVTIFDAATAKPLVTLTAPFWFSDMVISPDNKYLATVGTTGSKQDRHVVQVSEIKTRRLLHSMAGHKFTMWDVMFSHDSRMIASSAKFDNVILWDVETGKIRKRFEQFDSGCWPLVFSHDDQFLAAGGTWRGKSFCIWNTGAGCPPETVKPDEEKFIVGRNVEIEKLGFTYDGRLLIAQRHGWLQEREYWAWDMSTGKLAWMKRDKEPLSEHEQQALDESNGNSTAPLGADVLEKIDKILHPSGYIATASPHKKMFAAAGYNGLIFVGDVDSGKHLFTLAILPTGRKDGVNQSTWLSFTPEGYYTCPDQATSLIRWRINNKVLPLSKYASTYYKPDGLSGPSLK